MYPLQVPRNLNALGLSARDASLVRRLGQAGQGVILAAGPTGSGESSSLFAALAELNREGLNVVTLEDPMEYSLPGINQVQVNPLAGLTFPVALRAILRQDPDVVMVGEVRDRETAEIAMGAAVTGHLGPVHDWINGGSQCIGTILFQVALVITIVVLLADEWLIRGALAFIPAMLLAQRALGSTGNKVSDGLTGGQRDLSIREPIKKLQAILRDFQAICRLMGSGGITSEEALRRTNDLEKDLTLLTLP